MASGLPVVASRTGGIADIIEHEKNGLLCEEKDVEGLAVAINRVMTDDELRKIMVINGKITAQKNSYENVGKRYCEIIRNFV